MKRPKSFRVLVITVFITVFSLFLYFANLVVYNALAGIFVITTPLNLLFLGLSLFIFSGSFILATVLGMRYYNAFTRLYYLVSSVWIGFFTYLFFASVLYGLVNMVPVLPARSIGLFLIASALVVSVYGLAHAKKLRISKIEVTLPNLPEKWKGRKAVWISDVHLGQLYGPTYARKIVKKVNALPHDIIFIGGDLYDGTGAPDIAELAAPLGGFSAPMGIYFITGNHEEFGESKDFISAVRSAKIRPLIDEMVLLDGLQLIGIDYRNGAKRSSFKKILSSMSIKSDKPSILLKHEPKDVDVAQEAGISLQLSGHTHQGQLWPLGYIADLVYKGFGYGLKNKGGMLIYTSSGVATWGPPMRVGTDCEIVHITFV